GHHHGGAAAQLLDEAVLHRSDHADALTRLDAEPVEPAAAHAPEALGPAPCGAVEVEHRGAAGKAHLDPAVGAVDHGELAHRDRKPPHLPQHQLVRVQIGGALALALAEAQGARGLTSHDPSFASVPPGPVPA